MAVLLEPQRNILSNDQFLMSPPQSPWGNPQGNKPFGEKPRAPQNKENPNQNNQGKNQKPKEDFSKKFKEFYEKNFGGGNGGKNGSSFNEDSTPPKSLIGLIILGFVLLWLASGFYKIDADENGVVLYFGKFYSLTTPGLNYHIPYPFGQVIKKSVTKINNEEFGFSSSGKKSDNRNFDAESLMLTGDENIVDVEFQVQWQISDIRNFVFSLAEPNLTIRRTAESAMREIIARTPIASALSDGKKEIEIGAKDLLQQILDSYNAGIRIVLVQLRRVDPPAQVIDAFRDVQTAKADKEKEINQAQSYANDIVPRARGAASQMLQQAEAYNKEVVTNAEGEAGRFISVYNQYVKAPGITKKRIYIETMEKIYRDMDKVMIDKNVSKSGVLPYFPLNEIKEKK